MSTGEGGKSENFKNNVPFNEYRISLSLETRNFCGFNSVVVGCSFLDGFLTSNFNNRNNLKIQINISFITKLYKNPGPLAQYEFFENKNGLTLITYMTFFRNWLPFKAFQRKRLNLFLKWDRTKGGEIWLEKFKIVNIWAPKY